MEFASNPRFGDLKPGMPGTRHLTYHLGGGRDHSGTYYTLLRDGRILFIQNKPITNSDLVNDETPSASKVANRMYNSFLTTLQLLLDQIEFGRGDWAYLLRDDDGSYRFVYRKKPIIMSKYIWAPLIDENEIEITRWGLPQNREGWWKGREVNVYEPCQPCGVSYCEWQSEGHLIMRDQGLKDLTFELLGHLVRDGLVVGNVFEAAHGRLVEFSDRAAVYEAIARIQRKNVIYRDIDSKEIYITETGVRFGAGISSVVLVQDKDELEKEAETWHWGRLKKLFEFLKNASNDASTTRRMSSAELLIPRLPAPNAPVPVIPNFSQLAFAFALFVREPIEWLNWLVRLKSESESETSNHSRKRLTAPLDLSPIRSRRLPREDLIISSPYFSRVRLHSGRSRHPYSRASSSRTIRNDVTLSSDSSDSTLDDNQSPV